MTPDDFVKWLRGFMDGVEAASHDSWDALQGIKAKLKEVISTPAPVIAPSHPFIPPSIVPTVQPVWVGDKAPDWPKFGDIICQAGETTRATGLQ